MARRLTPDPLQTDPWTEPVRIRLPGGLYAMEFRVWAGLLQFGGFSLTGGADELDVQYEEQFWTWYFVPQAVGNPPLRLNTKDGRTLKFSRFIEYESLSIPHPVDLIQQPVKEDSRGINENIQGNRVLCPDDGNVCYDDLKSDHAVIDFRAGETGVWSLGGIIEIQDAIKSRMVFRTLNADGSLYDEFEESVQTISPTSGEITINGEIFEVQPIGIGASDNYTMRGDPDKLPSDFRSRFEPVASSKDFVYDFYDQMQNDVSFDIDRIISESDFVRVVEPTEIRFDMVFDLVRKSNGGS